MGREPRGDGVIVPRHAWVPLRPTTRGWAMTCLRAMALRRNRGRTLRAHQEIPMERHEENARRLVAALRALPEDGSPGQVPGDGEFAWDFGDYLSTYTGREGASRRDNLRLPEGYCGSSGCAMGLAKLMGITQEDDSLEEIAAALGLDEADAREVFHDNDTYDRDTMRDVTPVEVADELERRMGWAP